MSKSLSPLCDMSVELRLLLRAKFGLGEERGTGTKKKNSSNPRGEWLRAILQSWNGCSPGQKHRSGGKILFEKEIWASNHRLLMLSDRRIVIEDAIMAQDFFLSVTLVATTMLSVASSQRGCKTVSTPGGSRRVEQCIFPFRYNGKLYRGEAHA